MIRSTAIYGLVLAVLLALSWRQWSAEPEVDRGGKVELLAGKSSTITKVSWAGPKNEATLLRRSDEHGEYFWVDYTRWAKKPVPKSESKAEDGEPIELAEPELVAKESVFKADSDKADTLLKDFSPMLALRRLDVEDAAKMEEIGLADPEATLQITRGDQTQTLDVGGEAYGSRNIYVRRQEDGQVYLVERDLLQNIKYARSRLADHSLLGIPRKNVVRAVISAGEDTLETTQRNPDDEKKSVWVLRSDPESAPEQLTTWMGSAFKLKSMRHADPDALPEDLQARLTLQLFDSKGKSETLELLQVGQSGDWYGRSEHTRGLVKVVRSAAKSLADDVASVIEAGN